MLIELATGLVVGGAVVGRVGTGWSVGWLALALQYAGIAATLAATVGPGPAWTAVVVGLGILGILWPSAEDRLAPIRWWHQAAPLLAALRRASRNARPLAGRSGESRLSPGRGRDRAAPAPGPAADRRAPGGRRAAEPDHLGFDLLVTAVAAGGALALAAAHPLVGRGADAVLDVLLLDGLAGCLLAYPAAGERGLLQLLAAANLALQETGRPPGALETVLLAEVQLAAAVALGFLGGARVVDRATAETAAPPRPSAPVGDDLTSPTTAPIDGASR